MIQQDKLFFLGLFLSYVFMIYFFPKLSIFIGLLSFVGGLFYIKFIGPPKGHSTSDGVAAGTYAVILAGLAAVAFIFIGGGMFSYYLL